MPKGLAVPVGVGQNGGAELVEGDANDAKIIKLALGSDDNENAFQQGIGLGDGMVFDVADQTVRPKVVRRVIEIFRVFEAQQRYILEQGTIKWEQIEGSGETTLSFMYLQIESDSPKEFRQTFSGSRTSTQT